MVVNSSDLGLAFIMIGIIFVLDSKSNYAIHNNI